MDCFNYKCKWCGSSNISPTDEYSHGLEECEIGYECKDCESLFNVVYVFSRVEIIENGTEYKG